MFIKRETNKLNLAANISTDYSKNNAVISKNKKHESLEKFKCILILRLRNQPNIICHTMEMHNICHVLVGDGNAISFLNSLDK